MCRVRRWLRIVGVQALTRIWYPEARFRAANEAKFPFCWSDRHFGPARSPRECIESIACAKMKDISDK